MEDDGESADEDVSRSLVVQRPAEREEILELWRA
jgi:hypothetical protein